MQRKRLQIFELMIDKNIPIKKDNLSDIIQTDKNPNLSYIIPSNLLGLIQSKISKERNFENNKDLILNNPKDDLNFSHIKIFFSDEIQKENFLEFFSYFKKSNLKNLIKILR